MTHPQKPDRTHTARLGTIQPHRGHRQSCKAVSSRGRGGGQGLGRVDRRANTPTHTRANRHKRARTHTPTHTRANRHRRARTHTHTPTHTRANKQAQRHTHTYTHTHTRMQTHRHTHSRGLMQPPPCAQPGLLFLHLRCVVLSQAPYQPPPPHLRDTATHLRSKGGEGGHGGLMGWRGAEAAVCVMEAAV